MMKRKIKRQVLLVFLVILLLLSACGPSKEEIAATETQAAIYDSKTQTASVPTATDTPEPTSTFTATPTNTPRPTPNRTATAQVLATKQASSMAELVQSLYADGYVSTTEGLFYRIPNFKESWAQINWVRSFNTGYSLSDFIVSAHIAWETAREGANIKYSGCGFWFGVDEDADNFHEAMLALDGYVKLSRCLNDCNYITNIGRSYYGKIDYMKGEVDVILIVEDTTIQYFVNGEQIFIKYNQKPLVGRLKFALSSGTNAGFGTRCSFSDVELWDMNP